jgi:hypothetical protein
MRVAQDRQSDLSFENSPLEAHVLFVTVIAKKRLFVGRKRLKRQPKSGNAAPGASNQRVRGG